MSEDSSRRRRSQRHNDTPERVQQAAEQFRQEMNPVSSSAQHSAVPPRGIPAAATGTFNYNGGSPRGNFGDTATGQMTGEQAYASEYARQQYLAQQQYAAQQYAAQQQYAARQEAIRQEQERNRRQAQQTEERKRISSETSSHGAFRGYTSSQRPVEPPTPPAGSKGKTKGKRSAGVTALVVILALAILAGGAFAGVSYYRTKQIHAAVAPYDNLFCDGVYVDGIPLGGMTPEQALNSVQSQIQQRNDAWKVELSYLGRTVAEINAGMLGMSVDVGQIMNEAWAQGHTGTEEDRLAAMEALKESPYQAYTAVPSGDTSVVDNLLAQLKELIDTPAENAYLISFDPSNFDNPFLFSEEKTGWLLDTEAIREQLYHMVATLTGGTVEVSPEEIQPKTTVADLRKHYTLRASVYTPISTSSTEERNNNIRKAFEYVSGTILSSGKQFSFNSVVGERTEKRGFYPAIEYAYGEHVMGIGGGVCQASTTIYQAAVCAGMEIVKREPHSDSVSYTDYGKDATVYWGSRRKIDFVFKNNTDGDIYILAAVQEDPSNRKRLIARVAIYGEDLGDIRYEIESEITKELDPPEDPVLVKDTKGEYVTYTDQRKSVSSAKKGYVVDSWRVEYIGNVVNTRVHLYTDTYEAKAERIYVGVKKRGD